MIVLVDAQSLHSKGFVALVHKGCKK